MYKDCESKILWVDKKLKIVSWELLLRDPNGGERDDLTITVFIKLNRSIKERKRAEGIADTRSAVYPPLMFRRIKALSKRTVIQELITRSLTIFPGSFFTGGKEIINLTRLENISSVRKCASISRCITKSLRKIFR